MKKMMMGAALVMSLMMAQNVQARMDAEEATPTVGVDQDLKAAADAKKKEAKILQNAVKAKKNVEKAEKALDKARDNVKKAQNAVEKAEKELEKARKKAEEAQAEANMIMQAQ